MKIDLLFLILLVFVMGCSSNKNLRGNYIFHDDSKRELTLTFQNDSVCTLKNVYNCEKLENKELIFKCKYKVLSSKYLLLINDNRYVDTTGVGYFYFQDVKDMNCYFLEKKEKKLVIGPNYSTDYERYAKIPYVDNDTLISHKRKILWIKKDKANKVVGYYEFK